MNKLFTLMALAFVCTAATAQTDSTVKSDTIKLSPTKNDTIRVGNIVIVTNGKHDDSKSNNVKIELGRHNNKTIPRYLIRAGILRIRRGRTEPAGEPLKILMIEYAIC